MGLAFESVVFFREYLDFIYFILMVISDIWSKEHILLVSYTLYTIIH